MSKKTSLYNIHTNHGAKMVEFAGYQMPIQYKDGIIQEHKFTRENAGIFDVSHMGQAQLFPEDPDSDVAPVFEALVPGGIISLKEGGIRYTQLTNQDGGILDDLMVTRFGNTLWLVVNAACKNDDFAHIAQFIAGKARLSVENRALLALQGPLAEAVLKEHLPSVADLAFMQACHADYEGEKLIISRCGYTGEDGFEIYLNPEIASELFELIVSREDIVPAGLGCRDTLRFEARLPLYGNELSDQVTPIDTGLKRFVDVEGDAFIGQDILRSQVENGADYKMYGLEMIDKGIARTGVKVYDLADDDKVGTLKGEVTSGSFCPSLNTNCALALLKPKSGKPGKLLFVEIRGKFKRARIVKTPFYKRKV